jgi:hypothetical protein
MESLSEKFEHLFRVVSSQRFLKKQGIGNEIPFFISPFAPEEMVQVEKNYIGLIKRLQQCGVQVKSINLYDLCVEILKGRDNIWEQILSAEENLSKEELKELLQSVLNPEEYLIPAIAEKISSLDFDVLFLSGVGEIFPYIRSHNVLNNLQKVATEKPTVMFFPGSYRQSQELGASLDLFGKLHDDKYYRAFDIFKYQV